MTGVSTKTMLSVPCAELYTEIESGKIVKCNKNFLSLIGLDPDQPLSRDLYSYDYLDRSERVDLRKALEVQKSEGEFRGLCYLHRIKKINGGYVVAIGISRVCEYNTDNAYTTIVDISEFYDDKDTIRHSGHYSGKISEVYESTLKKAKLKEADKSAAKDAVTRLMNYTSFKAEVTAFLKSRDKSRTAAIAYFDINNFAYINENFGFSAGNEILCDTAKMLYKNANVLASTRIHSDFFAVAVEGESEDSVLKRIDKFEKLFALLNSQKYPRSELTLSIGVYFIKDEDKNARVVIDNANLARRHIKGTRRKRVCVFQDVFKEQRAMEQQIRSTIHQAIEDGEIEAFLQPKFSCSRMEIIGAEALARWRNEDGSYKQPFMFIPVLENAGYIVDLDFEIYRQVLSLIRSWIDHGVEPLPVSVNFSRIHNNYPDFVQKVINLTKEYDIDPKYIEIEFTESNIARDPDVTFKNMKQFAEFGFKIDMDDFGTGYSSLSFLRDAPVDIVKVDKTFVDQVLESPKDQKYVQELCKLIESTGKDVLLEGVEKKEQAEFFKSCGFDMAQGWLFDKAIPIDNFNQKYMYN
ncbi:MAG: GGDEF domain-containing protein [Ruminococcus sp.]|nr:GGDEF domain-containing protein [Ruminococcus sp.]